MTNLLDARHVVSNTTHRLTTNVLFASSRSIATAADVGNLCSWTIDALSPMELTDYNIDGNMFLQKDLDGLYCRTCFEGN
jgi:hypothetical protein